MKIQTAISFGSIKKLKKFKGLRNQNLNPWPIIIMLGVLVVVMIACVICK